MAFCNFWSWFLRLFPANNASLKALFEFTKLVYFFVGNIKLVTKFS